ncbi:hypothetical protein [Amycolatopsis sp. NPDC051128]|uniref:hypothetical protein n=1 Tax=Amycolatopsis sp. NPDC051128 TaxID=3155412 RepID=UPI003449CC54
MHKDLILAHDDMALADEYVSTVARFVERGIHKSAPASVDVLGMIEDVQRRIEILIGEVAGEDLVIARQQHAYAALMHFIYAEFLRMDPSRDSA